MDERDFVNPNGTFVDIGQKHRAFVPKMLPPDILYNHGTYMMVIEAERSVAHLRGIGKYMANQHIMIRAHLNAEAVGSSRIEGTMATLEDLYKSEVAGDPADAERLRLREVVNYVLALNRALKKMKAGGVIDEQLVLDAHRDIMSGVRGGDQSPGRFRTEQNCIAKRTAGGIEITYMPPPPDRVPDLLDNLMSFMRKKDDGVPPLIKCAIAHYQFEAIHPFLDGNGRVGRLILPLLLYQENIMPDPLLYLSPFFEENVHRYYGGLRAVGQGSGWNEWISFFMEAFVEQADATVRNIEKMQNINKEHRRLLAERKASAKASLLADSLVGNPYITIPTAQKILGSSYPTARGAVQALVGAGILEEADKRRGKRVYKAREMAAVLDRDGAHTPVDA